MYHQVVGIEQSGGEGETVGEIPMNILLVIVVAVIVQWCGDSRS